MPIMKKAYIKYFTALLLFGSNGIIASQINMSSYEIVLLRTFIGSLMLIAVYLIGGNRFTFTKKRKSFLFLVASGIAMGACWMFLYEAYQRVGGQHLVPTVLLCPGPCDDLLSAFIPRKTHRNKNRRFSCCCSGRVLSQWKSKRRTGSLGPFMRWNVRCHVFPFGCV